MTHQGLADPALARRWPSRLLLDDGAEGAHGAYVAYPLEDLLAVLALESERAKCLVIGEDLGTVPEGLRERLAEAGTLSYRVLPFERDEHGFKPPSAWPSAAWACVATHDLPPLAGLFYRHADRDGHPDRRDRRRPRCGEHHRREDPGHHHDALVRLEPDDIHDRWRGCDADFVCDRSCVRVGDDRWRRLWC